jgi:hypothetical protein
LRLTSRREKAELAGVVGPREGGRGPDSVVLHVAVAAEALEPALLAGAGHLGHEETLNLVANLVDGLVTGKLALFGEENEAALGKNDGRRDFTGLQIKEGRRES